MPDPIEHATGLERKELEAKKRGNDVKKNINNYIINICT
jgi:hypothetical protein